MFRFFQILCLLFICLASLADCKQPQLTPKDVRSKIEEILKAHVCHKALTKELMERTIQNFLEELDPTKTYFAEEDIKEWINPSDSVVSGALRGYKSADFSLFHSLHSLFLRAIDRRGSLERKISQISLPKGVRGDEFKDMGWAANEEELADRIARIRSLRLETVAKFDEDARGKFFQHLEKRRLNREAEFLDPNPEERSRLILSLVLKAMTSSLDSHTNYFTPGEANQFMIQVQGRLFGIGAHLQDDLDGLLVKRILENSPASQGNKIKINDKIIAVDGEPVMGLNINEAVELIRGEQGTSVLLTILRQSQDSGEERRTDKIEVELVRKEVVLEEVRLETSLEPFGDGVIANCKLFSFYQDPKNSSSLDIRKALEAVKKNHKLKGVLLDLRSNSGGLLTQAIAVTGLFINKGIVASIQDNSGRVQHLREIEGRPVWDGPLLILVNRGSASAAEIVAQALQDYGRAIVIGDPCTFGKGSFQTFTLDPLSHHKVNPEGEYKVTMGRYYTVSGKSPQLTGVISDIVVPGILSQLEIGEKYAKFPLENDSIEPHFEDDLSDISPLHKLQLGPMYRYNLQQRMFIYDPYKEILKKNSMERIKGNKNYQTFLSEIEKKNFDSDSIHLFVENDLQLLEAVSVMKDLIFLMDTKSSIE